MTDVSNGTWFNFIHKNSTPEEILDLFGPIGATEENCFGSLDKIIVFGEERLEDLMLMTGIFRSLSDSRRAGFFGLVSIGYQEFFISKKRKIRCSIFKPKV